MISYEDAMEEQRRLVSLRDRQYYTSSASEKSEKEVDDADADRHAPYFENK